METDDYDHTTTKFEITLSLKETGEGLACSFEYNTDLYNEGTVGRMITHFKELVKSIVEAPDEKLASLKMLSKNEEHQLLVEFNDTKSEYPRDKTIVDLFEEQVGRTSMR